MGAGMIKINLMKGDCIEKMKEIPDKSVDLVLTDPPYAVTGLRWDSLIPFDRMWAEIKRIVRNEKSATILFGVEPFSSALRMSNSRDFKYDWYWKKSTPSNWLDAKKRPMGIFEVASVFSEKPSYYYPQGLAPYGKQVSVPNNCNGGMFRSGEKDRMIRVQEHTNYPRNILEYKKDGKAHTSQKPVAMLEYLIKTYTLDGETVLDFTMGSGSTGVACKNLGRNFIGIERDDKYFEIAKARIENAS
jgi:DNA modification methylase